jgi:hypothetical protein
MGSTPGFSALTYVPYGSLGAATPSVIVDGAPAEGTVLTLSHWPGIGSPPEFWADLSAEMALRYVEAGGVGGGHHGSATVASNNHFDQDGLVGLFALTAPAAALARRDLLAEVARAGDFAVTSRRDAARISMAIAACADPERSPLVGLPPSSDYEAQTAFLYTELLGRLPELCDHPERFESLWAAEDASRRESEAFVASGAVHIEEVADLDLAALTVPEDAPAAGGHRFAANWAAGLHPMALHAATERGALLTQRGGHHELLYRYESWVQFRSRPVRPRVDLAPLAGRLNELETQAGGTATWVAERTSALTPALRIADGRPSALAPAEVRAQVEDHLRAAPPAWDPYDITR